LLGGYVGLNSLACDTSTNLAASGLASITHGHPSRFVLNISPYLFCLEAKKTLGSWE
jgi:hypothetical protein